MSARVVHREVTVRPEYDNRARLFQTGFPPDSPLQRALAEAAISTILFDMLLRALPRLDPASARDGASSLQSRAAPPQPEPPL